MATDARLADIALGDIEPERALEALAELFRRPEGGAAEHAYTALRAWVWKALDSRRRDAELREWYDILRRVSAFLTTGHPALAERIVALYELVEESISVSERTRVIDVLERLHVRELLKALIAAPSERLDRVAIGQRLGLKQGNLSRVLTMVVEAGFIERAAFGKHAAFQLTRAGKEVAIGLGYSAKAAEPPMPRHIVTAYEPQHIEWRHADVVRVREVLGGSRVKRSGYQKDDVVTQTLRALGRKTEKAVVRGPILNLNLRVSTGPSAEAFANAPAKPLEKTFESIFND